MIKDYFCENIIKEGFDKNNKYKLFPDISHRDFWEKIDCDIKKEFIKKAQAYLDYDFPGVPATTFLRFASDGDRICNEKIVFEKRNVLLTLFFAECFENKDRFLNKIIDGIWSVCEESTWAISAHAMLKGFCDKLPYSSQEEYTVDLFAAEAAQSLSLICFVLKNKLDNISRAVVKRVNSEIQKRIFKPFLRYCDFWWMGYDENTVVNNWNPWICRNVFLASMLCDIGIVLQKKLVFKIVECFDNYYTRYPDDGGCEEGTSYWFHSVGMSVELIYYIESFLCEKTGILQKENKIQNMCEFIADNRICDNYYVNFSDAASKKDNIDYQLIYFIGEILKSERLKDEGVILKKITKKDVFINDFHDGVSMINKLSTDNKISKQNNEKAPLKNSVHWYNNIELLISAESHGERGLFLAAKGGNNNESHNHNDVGSYIVFAGGRPAIIDVGVETYTKKTFSDERYKIWTMRSVFHNLPFCNDEEQKQGSDYRAYDTVFSQDENTNKLSMSLKNAYPNDGVFQSLKREFEHDTEKSSVIISDSALLHTSKIFNEVIMLGDNPIISDNTVKLKNCTLRFECTQDIVVKSEEIKIKDNILKQTWGNSIFRLIISTKFPCKSVVFRTVINNDIQ